MRTRSEDSPQLSLHRAGHGQTKPVTFNLMGGRTVAFKGMQKTGYTTEFKIKRSEFGITKFAPMLGDDIWVSVSFQGIKRR